MRDHQTMAQVKAGAVGKPHSVFMVVAEFVPPPSSPIMLEEFGKMKCPVCRKKTIRVERWPGNRANTPILNVRCNHCDLGCPILDLYIDRGRRNKEYIKKAVQQVMEAMPASIAVALMGKNDA